MRLFAGKRVFGGLYVGASVPFHPSRVFLSHGSGGYAARPWFFWFGLLCLAALIWFTRSFH